MQLYSKEELTSLLTRHDMIFEKPAKQWEQGVFMGNGLLGTVVWGGMDRPVKISLDRADIWDVRNATPDFEHGYIWKTFSECMEKKEYHTRFVHILSERGGQLRLRTSFEEGPVHVVINGEEKRVPVQNGLVVLNTAEGDEIVIYAGNDRPEITVHPLPGNENEYHYYGVKKIARF